MTFKIAMEHYQNGTATPEERALVEEELEKNLLISDYLDTQWRSDSFPEPAPEELTTVRKRLRRHNLSLILTSLLLAAALLLSAIFIVIPTLEKQYFNPQQNSFQCAYSTTDLELNLAAYTELFVDGLGIVNVGSTHTGFASYDLTIQHFNTARGGSSSYTEATLKKGILNIPVELLLTNSINIFERACYPFYSLEPQVKEDIAEGLSALPDYICVSAAVSFSEDMTMEQLLEFSNTLKEGHIYWVGIRNAPENMQRLPLCGMAPFAGGIIREGINDDYPFFEIKSESQTAENLESHFKSLLQFMDDRLSEGTAVGTWKSEDPYFQEVLQYVEENGVCSYGCYISAPAQVFLELLENNIISQVYPEDAWIDF